MIISFTGAQSTGKSTLLKLCKEEFGNRFSYVEEVTRLVKRQYNVPINEDAGNVTQLLIMNQHIVNSVQHTENVIMDRCCIDGFIYTQWLHEQSKVDGWVADYAARVANMLIKKLDIIFFCQADFDLVEDGERSSNEKFRDEIEQIMNSILIHSADFIGLDNKVVILNGSVEERMQKIKQTINNYVKQ
jgi:nicotinamide riboside kinase